MIDAVVEDPEVVQDEIKDGSVKPTCKSIIEFTIKSRDKFHARVLAKTKQPRTQVSSRIG